MNEEKIIKFIRLNDIKSLKRICKNEFNIDYIDSNGITLLMHGCLCKNFDIVKYLLRFKPNLFILDGTGKSAFEISCELKLKYSAMEIINSYDFSTKDSEFIVSELINIANSYEFYFIKTQLESIRNTIVETNITNSIFDAMNIAKFNKTDEKKETLNLYNGIIYFQVKKHSTTK